MSIEICKVNNDSISIFASILREAAKWMEGTGKKNWEPSRFTTGKILMDNDMSELYICYIDDEPAGCFRMQFTDEMFWPEKPEGEAIYIHKLAVRRKFAGKGISKVMVDWVKRYAADNEFQYVRLDCIANREKLCKVYEMQDFSKIDEKQVFGNSPSARFEYRTDI